jgi:hypothetical protein
MRRRILISCVLTACLGVVARANHPATFVLTSGERVSGELSYKGGTNYTLNGRDYPSDQIAIVAFVPGDPSADELRQLPAVDKNPTELERHVFVTRAGEVILGKIYHISPDGNTITFDRRGGGRQEMAADNLARVYVNPGAARSLYGATTTNNAAAAAAPAAASGAAPFGSIQVNANQQWTDTGVTVKRGDRLAFQASGEIKIAPDFTATPDGSSTSGPRASLPVAAMAAGGLIGRIGNGAAFPIGSNSQPIAMPANGRLFLGVNDDQMSDNSGSFAVSIRK